MNIYADYHARLLNLARESIQHGLSHGGPLEVDITHFPEQALQETKASFVTLHKHGELRGCIGQLIATRPLVIDIAMNAYAAAFQDPRFPSLTQEEYPHITLDISILSQPKRLAAHTDEEILAEIEPGQDGVIIEKGSRRGTFLPSVWEQLPNPSTFLTHLKHKAGIDENDQSPEIIYYRYQTEILSE